MNKFRIGILIFVVLCVAGIIIYIKLQRKRKVKELTQLRQALKAGIGAKGEDIDTILLKIAPDKNFRLNDSDYKLLNEAHGSVYDSPENFTKVLSGKTKAQIKALSIQFENKKGQSLNEWVTYVLSDLTGFDNKTYTQILNIVKSAK